MNLKRIRELAVITRELQPKTKSTVFHDAVNDLLAEILDPPISKNSFGRLAGICKANSKSLTDLLVMKRDEFLGLEGAGPDTWRTLEAMMRIST